MTDLLHRDTSTASLRASPIPDKTRRRLLVFGAGAAGAASVSALAAAPAVIADPAQPQPASQGYRETEHVRNYYATTRL
jgi:hypothetical protein